jgi:hypothetical protein
MEFMKIQFRKSFILLLLLFFIGLVSVAQKNSRIPLFPSYKTVLKEFFSKYSRPEFDSYEGVNFAKKKDGWHVYTYYYLADSVVKDELFWSSKKNKYLKIDYPIGDVSTSESSVQQYLQIKSNVYGFNLSPYYGYAGWNIDLINDFSSCNSPDDTLLESLARAYSTYASELIGDNVGFANRKVKLRPAPGLTSLSRDQLAIYRNYVQKAKELYYALWERNPDYITLVGDIYNKYSTEFMAAYMALLMHHSYEEARKELKEGLFDSFTLDMYRKHLACCDSNAILFTSGDMDTYTTLYLQEMENFRRDVLVVNFGMLFIGKYVSTLYKSYAGRNALETTLPADIYLNELKPIVYVNNEPVQTDLKNALEVLISEEIRHKMVLENDTLDCIPSKHIELITTRESIPTSYFNYDNLEIADTSKLSFELSASFLYQNDVIMLDIMNTCHFNRPIYFTTYTYNSIFDSLAEYMQMEGPNYKLMPFRPDGSNQSILQFDPDVQFQKLVHDSPPYVPSPSQKYYYNQSTYLQYYGTLYYTAANELIRENKADSARILINHYIKNYLSDSTAYNPGLLGVVWVFYELNDIDSARYYANKTCDYMQKSYNLFMQNPSKYAEDIALSKDFALYLSTLTQQYDPNSDINNRITKFYNNISGEE